MFIGKHARIKEKKMKLILKINDDILEALEILSTVHSHGTICVIIYTV